MSRFHPLVKRAVSTHLLQFEAKDLCTTVNMLKASCGDGRFQEPSPVWSASHRALYFTGLSWFLVGYSIAVVASCGELIPVVFEWCRNDWQHDCLVSRACQSLVNAALYLGASAASHIASCSLFTSRGFRFAIWMSDGLFVLGGVLCAAAHSFPSLLLGRLISGFAMGLSAVAASVYTADVSALEHCSCTASLSGTCVALGVFTSVALGMPLSPLPQSPSDELTQFDRHYWRALLGLPALLALVQAGLFFWTETADRAYVLVRSGRLQDARHCLYSAYGLPSPRSKQFDQNHPLVTKLNLHLNDLMEVSCLPKNAQRIPTSQAVRDPYFRPALFVGFGLAALHMLCGICALLSYSDSMFREAGVQRQYLTLTSATMCAAYVVVSFWSPRVLEIWSYRSLLLAGVCCQALAMCILATLSAQDMGGHTGLATFGCLTLFAASFGCGLGTATWSYLSEIYPVEIRTSALSSCGVITWLSACVVVLAARFLSLQNLCRFFGFICTLGCLFVYFWILDTKTTSDDSSPATSSTASPPDGSSRLSSVVLSPRCGQPQSPPCWQPSRSSHSAPLLSVSV